MGSMAKGEQIPPLSGNVLVHQLKKLQLRVFSQFHLSTPTVAD